MLFERVGFTRLQAMFLNGLVGGISLAGIAAMVAISL
jgi:hypothetical protein